MSQLKRMLLLSAVLLLTACGTGSKLIKEPEPVQTKAGPLASTSQSGISLTLDWVIIRDGPGSWATNADWDEYLLRVHNHSDHSLELTGVAIFDSLGNRLAPASDRKSLIAASRQTEKRYKDAGVEVRAGLGGVGLFATGAAVATVGAAAATAAAYGAILGGGSSVGAAGAVAGGLLVAGPVLAIGGIVRGANNRKVDEEIQQRGTQLPMTVAPGEQATLDIFFPLAPSPTHLELSYGDSGAAQVLTLDLGAALKGLHLESLPQ